MKFSIVSAVLNAAPVLERTLDSVLTQTGVELEYIVIDGGSTDGTQQLLERYQSRLAYCVSEPDGGIYEAMNKGIRRATGDVVGLINAGDFYFPGAFAAVRDALDSYVAGGGKLERVILWGDVEYSKLGRVKGFREENRKTGAFAPHPSMFCPLPVYRSIGDYDESFQLLGDYEFMYRAINVEKIHPLYLPQILAFYQEGGLSDRQVGRCLREELRVKLRYGQNPLFCRLVYWLKLLKNLPRL